MSNLRTSIYTKRIGITVRVLIAWCCLLSIVKPSPQRQTVQQPLAPAEVLLPACESLPFTDVSREMWNCFKDAVSLQMAVSFSNPDTGRISLTGMPVNYSYDARNKALRLTTESSWWRLRFVTCDEINKRITEFLGDCRGPKIQQIKNDRNSEVWRIERPEIKQSDTTYPMIKLRLGDRVRIDAGGCVQTGGKNDTWRLYVDPRGIDSNQFYHGLIRLPGMEKAITIRQFVSEGNNHEVTKTEKEMAIHLGYQDKQGQYANNGYWGKDRGVDGQCLNQKEAWVEIGIYHPAK
jgi:hypothetical protein